MTQWWKIKVKPLEEEKENKKEELEKEEKQSLLNNELDRPRNFEKSIIISRQYYNLLIGLILIYGFITNYFECYYLTDLVLAFFFEHPIVFMGGYFVMAIFGCYLSKNYDNPWISFLGYNLVVVPVGLIVSIAVSIYDNVTVLNVCILTGTVACVMTCLSIAFPKIFAKLGYVLSVILLILFIHDLIWFFWGSSQYPTAWDIVAAILFSLYIGYDWYKAQNQEYYTLDAAVDACVGLYLDIVNLFLRLLRLKRK